MVDVSKIFKKKKTGTSTRFTVIPPSIINRLSDAELEEALSSIGSARLLKICDSIKHREDNAKKEREESARRLKPNLEVRSKIDKAIEETVKTIRLLPEENLTTEGIKEAKNLCSLLAEMEQNDNELTRLGISSTYSYRSSDIPLENTPATLLFLNRIRANMIFRQPKPKEN